MTDIKWEEPISAPKTRWQPIATALRENPMRWALVAESEKNRNIANNISAGRLQPFAPKGAFESTSRRANDGSFAIYARFIGEVSS